jgi:NAD(P)-dependent dehydrogenase (short-subunit alcohol dehydrogenase family)
MSGLTVFLTGAGRGIGAALAHALAERGEQVFAGVHPRPGQEARAASVGDAPVPVPIDVTDDGSVVRAAALVAARSRHINILLNVAGVLGDTRATLPGAFDFDDMHRTYEVNAVGPVRVTNAFFPLLLAGRTRLVVNISSEAGSIGTCTRDGWYGYCMSKAALNMASAIMHNRLRPLGGQVLVMHPGWVRTWMTGNLDEAADLSPEESAQGIIAGIDRALRSTGVASDHPAFIDWKGAPVPW